MIIIFWFFLVFIIGIVVGSFLNVCIARLPLEKSLLWPNSRCGSCFQSIAWYDNLPLISYLWLRGRCRTCRASYSPRYLMVEFLTGLGFVGLFYVEVVFNIHQWPVPGRYSWAVEWGFYPPSWWIGFGYHALLFCFLMVASACDLDGREIPISVTVTGTIFGVIGSVFLPWPFPFSTGEAMRPILARPGDVANTAWWQLPPGIIKQGIYPWPVWGPIPEWLPPNSWQMGLATSIVGLLVGTLMLRGVAYLFGKGLGKEALGLGDADLMMMAGAFLGWQAVVIAFFVSVFPALVIGILQLLIRRDGSLPFGPSLSIGIMTTVICWQWVAPPMQILLFWDQMMIYMTAIAAAFMLGAAYFIRFTRPSRKNTE